MTEPDNFISVYDEKSNPIDIPYPFVSGLPMHPSEVIKLHNKGEFFFRCAHGIICEAWYIRLNSANEHHGCAFIHCPKQINHQCGLYVKLNDIHSPLLRIHCSKASHQMESYPSPPQSWKCPSSSTKLPDTPTKRFKNIQMQIAPSSIPAPFPVKLNSPSIDYPPGSYFLLPPFEDNGCILPEASDDELVSSLTALSDATVGPKGAVIYDKTKQSQGTFSLTSIDIEILIKQLRGMEELKCHELRLNQQELRLKLKAFKGAGVGPDNQMIGPPDPAFFAMGSSKEYPIDMDYIETCADCSQEIDAALHKELCLGIF
ncbi:hypothetical protein C8J55DRAFT_556141 [Lentinula edodes]|uniref:Uncharacterized protein n=1 Tax=Lentinula lateritia TaxID=40482 RepID=A0A9W9E0D6_9AGAR|nr:hypothetical protein C8J55DRAFT_556141 [Lentinula edodes]